MGKLKARLRRAEFITTYYSIVFNPSFILRHGLYKAITKASENIEGHVLDFGCGSKPYETLFEKAETYTGVDIESSGHQHSESRIDVFYDGRNLPFPDNHFDSVVCFDVFEHVFNIDEVLEEIARVLRPGGKILLSVPFAWDEHEIPFDFARYTSFGLMSVLERNGYTVVALTKTTTYFLAISQIFIAYLEQCVLPKGRVLGRVGQLVIIFPISVMALILNNIFPKRYEYYSSMVVLASNEAQK